MKSTLQITEQTSTDQTTFLRYNISGRLHSISYEFTPSPGKEGTYLIQRRIGPKVVVVDFTEDPAKAKKRAYLFAVFKAKDLLNKQNIYSQVIDNTTQGKLEQETRRLEEEKKSKRMNREQEFFRNPCKGIKLT